MTLITMAVVTSFVPWAFSFDLNRGKRSDVGSCDDFDSTALSQLTLSVEQTTEINILREAFLKDTRPIEDKMLSKRNDLKLLWLQQNPDKEKITIVQKQIRALRNQINDKREVYRLKVYNLLTHEQEERLKSCNPGRSHSHDMRSRTR